MLFAWRIAVFALAFNIYGVMGRFLESTSLVTCMQDSKISPTFFNVTFNPDSGSIRYDIDLTTEINAKVNALVQVYAYGFLIIEQTVDVCSLNWKQFCPLHPGSLQVESIEQISKHYVDEIPGIAFTVPDIDAVVKVLVYDIDTNEHYACLQASFTNGKTVAQTGAKWATAVIAGLGLLIAAVSSVFGNSNAASHISANASSLFLYFQSVVVVSMIAVERVPPIASAWAENLAWSMGLIRVTFMQKIFRWYVQSTGGNPSTILDVTSKQILVQRAQSYLRGLHEFARRSSAGSLVSRSLSYALHSNKNLEVLRGIKRIGFNSHIEPTSIVATGLTFFVILGYVLVVVLLVTKVTLNTLVKHNKVGSEKFRHFRTTFVQVVKGSLLRYVFFGFTQLIILTLWEFTVRDSPALIAISAICLVTIILELGFSFWQVLRVGKLSIAQFDNPAALLYGDNRVLDKFGFCYTMFDAKKYWFGIVIIVHSFIKGIFVALCQASGKTSALVIFILDLAYAAFLIYEKPYLNKPTNIINYVTSIVVCVNSFLFLFFSDLFGQPAPVASIMGWVFFILNAAYSFCLLAMILVFIGLIVFSKNSDSRFMPANDDRASFQRQNSVRKSVIEKNTSNELLALGIAAQDHSENWENDMYKLQDMASSGDMMNSHLTPSLSEKEFKNNSNEEAPKRIGSKFMKKLPHGIATAFGMKDSTVRDKSQIYQNAKNEESREILGSGRDEKSNSIASYASHETSRSSSTSQDKNPILNKSLV